jgi:hypothetical protein
MRLLMISALVGMPLLGIPAQAADNDYLGQAQRFLNNGNGNNDQERAYERGRRDEDRRNEQQAERNRDRYDSNGYPERRLDDRRY